MSCPQRVTPRLTGNYFAAESGANYVMTILFVCLSVRLHNSIRYECIPKWRWNTASRSLRPRFVTQRHKTSMYSPGAMSARPIYDGLVIHIAQDVERATV